MRIAFLGLGKMGLALVPHLAQGHTVTVWNRTPKKGGPPPSLPRGGPSFM